MGQTREQKIIKQVIGRPTEQKFTPIATEMFLPNHSGDHSAGIVNRTPTADNDIVNKAYVDSMVGGVDWTLDQSGVPLVIHAANYVDNNTTDHTALSNIGTNTHAQIDTALTNLNKLTFVSGTKTITATGTWVPNTAELVAGNKFFALKATTIKVIGSGGSGASGGGGSPVNGGGGGGGGSSGGYGTASNISLDGATTYTGTIGGVKTGGAGVGTNTLGNNGTDGTASTFAGTGITTVTGNAGNKGLAGIVTPTAGGVGGAAPTGGNAGTNGQNATGGSGAKGIGGAAPYSTYGKGGDGSNGGNINGASSTAESSTAGVVEIVWVGCYLT